MIRERPHLDREKVLVEEEARASVQSLVQQIAHLLAKDEGVGTPYRTGSIIVIPIATGDDENEERQALHTLVAAWLDDPAEHKA